jgi:hypothetical protein
MKIKKEEEKYLVILNNLFIILCNDLCHLEVSSLIS